MDPQVPQWSLQFCDAEWLLFLHLVNYEIPGILIWVEVGKIARSVNSVYVLLFKPLLHLICLMSWSIIRLKWRPSWIGQNEADGVPVRHRSVLLHCNIFGRYCRPSLPRFLLVTLHSFRKPGCFTVFMIHLKSYLKLPPGPWSALTLLLPIGMCFHPKISLSPSQQMFIKGIPCKIEVSYLTCL